MFDPKAASAPPTSKDTLAGTPYRFLRRLGEGAYGVVVEAEQIALRRTVVVKLLRHAHADREDVVDRLRLEAQAIAALSPLTPHVVSVLDFGRTPDGRPYIVMERLHGRSLRDELADRGALPPAEAVEIAAQILEGLAVAHDAGILHRDIKPDNVFLCVGPGGQRVVKLLDFGLAKLVGASLDGRGPAPLAKPTDEDVMLGTPRYFSPEQARGAAATARSDLYSAGVVLYAMLAGRDPFRHCTNVYDLVIAHLTEAPEPPSTTAPRPIPAALDGAVLTALAKAPDHRHADARAFRRAIEAALRAPRAGLARTVRLAGVFRAPTLPAPALQVEDVSATRTLPFAPAVRRAPAWRRVARVAAAAGAVLGTAALLVARSWLPQLASSSPVPGLPLEPETAVVSAAPPSSSSPPAAHPPASRPLVPRVGDGDDARHAPPAAKMALRPHGAELPSK